MVEGIHDLPTTEKERLAAYLWLGLQCGLRVCLYESFHSSLGRAAREKFSSHLIVHQHVLETLRILVDCVAQSCQSSCVRRPVASTYIMKGQLQFTGSPGRLSLRPHEEAQSMLKTSVCFCVRNKQDCDNNANQ